MRTYHIPPNKVWVRLYILVIGITRLWEYRVATVSVCLVYVIFQVGTTLYKVTIISPDTIIIWITPLYHMFLPNIYVIAFDYHVHRPRLGYLEVVVGVSSRQEKMQEWSRKLSGGNEVHGPDAVAGVAEELVVGGESAIFSVCFSFGSAVPR